MRRGSTRRTLLTRHAILLLAIALLIPSGKSEARMDPLRYLTDQVVRPEIIFVLDTSGSMVASIAGGTSGSDCSGHDPQIDVCGDKMCGGHERWAPVSCGSSADCAEHSVSLTCTSGKCQRGTSGTVCGDCTIFDDLSYHAGSTEMCRFGSTAPAMSRMFLSKRAMRNVMSEFRGVANFGLVAFGQGGYYRYQRADSSQTPVNTGVFLHEWEMRSTGSWTLGKAWDTGGDAPQASFLLGDAPPATTNVTYSLLNAGACAPAATDPPCAGDSLYRSIDDYTMSADQAGDWKGWSGCSSTFPCAAGQGDCDWDSQCMAGLRCVSNNAVALYGTSPSGAWDSSGDVCVPNPIGTWTYTPKQGKRYIFRRANWASWGRVHDDGSHKWEYQGSFYTYPAHHIKVGGVGGVGSWDWAGCSSSSPCAAGQGDCDWDGECQSGLVCVHDKAHLYNATWPTTGDVCDLPVTQTISTFKGPEYYDAGGTRWVFNRYGGYHGSSSNPYGMWGQSSGSLKVGLVPASKTTAQNLFDENLGKIMNHMNDARVGGLFASGGTPTCKAIDRAYTHLQNRRNGTGDGFSSPDEAKDCRPRFVIVLSDGESNSGCNSTLVRDSAKRLYDDFGVRVIGMAIPGSSPGGIGEMDLVSDCGDDGNCYNGSASAVLSNSEKELVDNLRNVIFNAIKGQYTTAPSGVTWSGSSNVEGDVSVTPSTEFPGWRGILEAKDLLQDPPVTKWEAGTKLQGRDWKTRLILSGTHVHNTGTPFKLFDASGAVDTGAISAVWPTAMAPLPTPAELTGFIEWLGGKDRDWKLPPIIRSVPASIGPPPAYSGLGDHGTFETMHALRQRLLYITSNEGLLHAFDARTGDEVWAFMPPHLMPAAYALYKAGGQNEDPRQFKYILASSPRVDDIKSEGAWKTLLVLGDGPGGENIVALDISNMPTCNEAVPPVCTSPGTFAKPEVLYSSYYGSPALDGQLGETWSTPAIFWKGDLKPGVAMGSGYVGTTPGDGYVYNAFEKIHYPWSTHDSHLKSEIHAHTPGSAGVDYGLLSDTVAVVDPSNMSEIKATYQSDLMGRVWAYDQGKADSVRKIINFTHKEPVHYSPAAVYNETTSHVLLAFATGAYQDDDIQYDPGTNSMQMQEGPGGTFVTKFYIYEDDFSGSASELWSLKATDICGLATTADFATNCNGGPCTCETPSNRAMVVASPIIARNLKFGDRIEAFFVLYDPPSDICSSGAASCPGTPCNSWETCVAGTCQSIGIGDSYIFRVVIDPASGTAKLAQSFRHENVQASGLTVVGGGSDVTLSVSGRGSSKAGVQTLSGESLATALSTGGRASVEAWREVR